MNSRALMLTAALAALAAGGAHHWQTMRTQEALESERRRAVAEAQEKQLLYREDFRRAESARKQLEAILAKRAEVAANATNPAGTSPAGDPAAPPARPGATNPEMRRLEMQEFISGQRLRFGALFARLDFTPEKQQAFDRILGAYEEVRRYETSPERQREAEQVREAQLRQLFGASYGQFIAAGLNRPARESVVNQIVTLTFQSSGTLTSTQADELTKIAARHRLPPTPTRYPGQSQFDWDRILADAQGILTEQQRKDFGVAIDYRRAQAQMTAITAKHNPRTAPP